MLYESLQALGLDKTFDFRNQVFFFRPNKKELVPEVLSLGFVIKYEVIEGDDFFFKFGFFVGSHSFRVRFKPFSKINYLISLYFNVFRRVWRA